MSYGWERARKYYKLEGGAEPTVPEDKLIPPAGMSPEELGEIVTEEKTPLSDEDIRAQLGDGIKIIKYKDLQYAPNFRSIADPKGRAVVYFQTRDDYGHWIAMWSDERKGLLNVYDSYGSPGGDPDAEPSTWVKPKDRVRFGVNRKQFQDLALRSGLKLVVNRTRDQSDDAQTCGRFVILRLLHKNMSDGEFDDYLRSIPELRPDEFVTMATSRTL